MDFYDYTNRYGDEWQLGFARASYLDNGNLAILSYCLHPENGGWTEPYANITVNIENLDNPYLAAVDTNNLGDNIVEFLIGNGIAVDTGMRLRSGFCEYPVMEFDQEWVDALDE